MIYKGYELIKAIEDSKIAEGTEFYDRWGNEYIYSKAKKTLILKNLDNIIPDYELFINNEFEVIESDNIEDIEELDEWITRRDGEVTQQEGKRLEMCYKINELVRSVNQIKKEIKKCK